MIATTRQPEATLRHEWQQALPGILGGLLDLAATVHQRLETISVDEPPRMADYGRTLAAVDEALASNGLRRYLSRADQLSEDSLSADPFIEQLRLHTREPLVGKSGGDLLAMTTPVGDHWRRPKEWPRNGRDVTAILSRHAPALRSPRAIHRFACLKVDTYEFRPAISDRYRPGMQEVCVDLVIEHEAEVCRDRHGTNA